MVDATVPMRRDSSDIGMDAIDPPDEGAEPVPAPVGELVGAAEYKEE